MKTKQNIKCVTISNNLTWDRHIDNTIGKGNKTLGFIRRSLKDCTKPVKSAAYTSMVRPTMEYGTRQTGKRLATLKKYKKEQHDSFSIITDRTPGCVTKMVESLKWEKLEERRKSNRLCMLYKIKNGLIDIDSHQYIQDCCVARHCAKFSRILIHSRVNPVPKLEEEEHRKLERGTTRTSSKKNNTDPI